MKFYAKGETIHNKTIGNMSVLQHCIDVGLVCKLLLERVYDKEITELMSKKLSLDKNSVISLFTYFSSLHDIGKIHLYFQMYFDNAIEQLKSDDLISDSFINDYKRNSKEYHIRHEVITRKILQEYYSEYWKNKLFKGLCYALSSHHEKDTSYDREPGRESDAFFRKEQDKLVGELHNIFPFDMSLFNEMNLENVDTVCEVFLGLLILSDWIASSNYLYDNGSKFDDYYLNNNLDNWIYERKLKILNVLENNLGLINKNFVNLDTYDKIFCSSDYELRPVQKKVKEICDKNKYKFMLIEAPMGEGKTEAGLYAVGHMSYNKKGFYMALPTGATSSMMYDRLVKIFKSQEIYDLNILYSLSFLEDKLYKSNLEDTYNLFSSTRTGLFIQNGVGTVDQSMMGVLKSKFAILRLIGLMGKVLIIDEIHAYDAYMKGILHILLRWCNELEIPVVLLSATLPISSRQELVKSYLGKDIELKNKSYPLITCITEDDEIFEYNVGHSYMSKDINFNLIRMNQDYSLLLNYIKNDIELNKNIGIICNTVKESINLYNFIVNQIKNYEIVLLNSNFKVIDRKEKEEYIRKCLGKTDRKQNLMVIGTQVLEQSLDIDFDSMYSYLCPIDLLLQRLGRWRRFEIANRDYDNTVNVILPLEQFNYIDSGYSLIYSNYILKKSECCLLEKKSCKLPEDFRTCIESVYGNVEESDDEFKKYNSEQETLEKEGSIVSIKEPQGNKFQRSTINNEVLNDIPIVYGRTRLSIPKRNIILVDKNELVKNGYDISKLPIVDNKNLSLELLKNLVSVNVNNYVELEIEPDSIMECDGYLKGYKVYFTTDNQIRFLLSKNGEEYNCNYTYSKELGLIIDK